MQPRIAFYSRRAFLFVFAICISAFLLACSSARAYTPELWHQTMPNGTLVFRICRRHPLVSPETRYWYVEKGNDSPRITHLPLPELLESGTARAVFIYDPYAPTESRVVLGIQFHKLPCDKPPPPPPPPPPPKMEAKAESPRKSAQTTVKTVTRPHSAPSRNARLDQRFLGQSYPTPAPTPGSKVPDPPPPPGNTPAEQRANLTQIEAEAKAKRDGERVGAAWGDVVGKATAALETLDGVLGGSLAELLARNPKFAEDLRNGLAQKMNAIPALPTYEDPKLAKIAFEGFLKGYGQGVDDARLEFGLVNGLAAALLMVSGDSASAVETAGAKALRAAWTRLREMPIFVPIGAGGPGGFVKVPKASAPAAAVEAEAAKTTVTTKVTSASTKPAPVELRPYGGPGGGHHVPAKKTFTGAPGYDSNKALAIPNAELKRLGIDHAKKLTPAQRRGYIEFGKTGQSLTWESVAKIETDALVEAGMKRDVAQSTVAKAIQALKDAGITGPVRIPWGK